MSKIMINNGSAQNHGNVPNHDFPRFCRFVKRNGPDTGTILTQNDEWSDFQIFRFATFKVWTIEFKRILF